MLRIKLVKTGKKDRPTWRVVVIERTKTGKGLANDYIGSYNPHLRPKEFKLDLEKYNDWIKKGAQPTDAIKRLKGKFVDKTKDYQKEVKTKVYKKKKPEEEKKVASTPKSEEKLVEVAEETKTEERPVEAVEEPKIEEKTAEEKDETPQEETKEEPKEENKEEK